MDGKGAMVGLVIVGVIAGVYLVVQGANSSSPTPPNPKSPFYKTEATANQPPAEPAKPKLDNRAPAFDVKASELMKAYSDNEVAADNRYKGRRFRVIGKIAGISKDFMDEVYLTLRAGQYSEVFVYPQPAFGQVLAAAKKGEMVGWVCTGDGMTMGSPVLRDCVPAGD